MPIFADRVPFIIYAITKESKRRIMRKTFSFELMTKFSFREKLGKRPFDKTHVNQIIICKL